MAADALVRRFPALNALSLGRGSRITPVSQTMPADCGAACLTMVLGLHGRAIALDEVRQVMGIGRDGASLKTLLDAAAWYGLRGRGVRIGDLDDLTLAAPGTVLHWNFDHFVVLESATAEAITVVDPALGRRRVPREEASRAFTGIALLLEPGEGFTPSLPGENRLWTFVRSVLGSSDLWRRILGVSVLLQLLALGLPVLTGLVVDRIVPRGETDLLAVVGAGLAAVVVFQGLATLVRGHLLLHLRTLLDARITLDFVDHLVELPYGFFASRAPGDLLMRLNSSSTLREILTSGVLSGLLDSGLVLLYLAVLALISPTLAGVVLALGAAQVAVLLGLWRRQQELMGLIIW